MDDESDAPAVAWLLDNTGQMGWPATVGHEPSSAPPFEVLSEFVRLPMVEKHRVKREFELSPPDTPADARVPVSKADHAAW